MFEKLKSIGSGQVMEYRYFCSGQGYHWTMAEPVHSSTIILSELHSGLRFLPDGDSMAELVERKGIILEVDGEAFPTGGRDALATM